jgi:hypothetical protein
MPAGRRSTRTREQRIEQLKKDVIRSGFTGQEILQILVDWHGYREVIVRLQAEIAVVISNSTRQGDSK